MVVVLDADVQVIGHVHWWGDRDKAMVKLTDAVIGTTARIARSSTGMIGRLLGVVRIGTGSGSKGPRPSKTRSPEMKPKYVQKQVVRVPSDSLLIGMVAAGPQIIPKHCGYDNVTRATNPWAFGGVIHTVRDVQGMKIGECRMVKAIQWDEYLGIAVALMGGLIKDLSPDTLHDRAVHRHSKYIPAGAGMAPGHIVNCMSRLDLSNCDVPTYRYAYLKDLAPKTTVYDITCLDAHAYYGYRAPIRPLRPGEFVEVVEQGGSAEFGYETKLKFPHVEKPEWYTGYAVAAVGMMMPAECRHSVYGHTFTPTIMEPTPVDPKPSDGGVDSTPSDVGVDSTPSNGGVDSTPSNVGVDSTPSNVGVDSAPSDVGMDSVPSDGGADSKPLDGDVADSKDEGPSRDPKDT